MPDVPMKPVKTLKEFLDELHNRKNLRLVRLADYGLVEPAKRHGAFVMQPMVRVVATALDRDAPEIVRYQEQKDADQMVTVVAGTDHGRHNDSAVVARKDELKTLFQAEGFQVEEGEWTSASAAAFLEVRRRALG